MSNWFWEDFLHFLSLSRRFSLLVVIVTKMASESGAKSSPSPSVSTSSSNAADAYIGSFISLISKSEIRYKGVLCYLNVQDSNIGLNNGIYALILSIYLTYLGYTHIIYIYICICMAHIYILLFLVIYCSRLWFSFKYLLPLVFNFLILYLFIWFRNLHLSFNSFCVVLRNENPCFWLGLVFWFWWRREPYYT